VKPWKITVTHPVYTGQMLFLMANQQWQSTEGKYDGDNDDDVL